MGANTGIAPVARTNQRLIITRAPKQNGLSPPGRPAPRTPFGTINRVAAARSAARAPVTPQTRQRAALAKRSGPFVWSDRELPQLTAVPTNATATGESQEEFRTAKCALIGSQALI